MTARNRDMEIGCQLTLVALVLVACIAGIPPIFNVLVDAVAQSRISATPMRFSCRSCGEVEAVHEVTLGGGKHNVSTVTGDAIAMFLGMMTGGLGSQPVKVLEVEVRLQDGSLRVFHERASSAWQPGDRVKVAMGRIKPAS
jgi:outer membrane lipoprotein SlyB